MTASILLNVEPTMHKKGQIKIKAKNVPAFSAGKALKDAVK